MDREKINVDSTGLASRAGAHANVARVEVRAISGGDIKDRSVCRTVDSDADSMRTRTTRFDIDPIFVPLGYIDRKMIEGSFTRVDGA